MTTLAKARLRAVFPVERRGDTYVVAPKGDALGFSPAQIQVEIRVLEKLFDDPKKYHLIIDLKHANYFGSEMIGLIHRLGMKARSQGGRIAFCNVSSDMQEVFEVIKFDQLWEFFDSTRGALKAMATIPLSEHVLAWKKSMYRAVAVAAIGLALYFFPWPDRHRDYYETMMSYSTELKEINKFGSQEGARNGFRKRVERSMKPMLMELNEDASQGDMASTYLYMAGKQCLLPLLNAHGMERSALERDFACNMASAARYIQGVSPPVMATPQETPVESPAQPTPIRAASRPGSTRQD